MRYTDATLDNTRATATCNQGAKSWGNKKGQLVISGVPSSADVLIGMNFWDMVHGKATPCFTARWCSPRSLTDLAGQVVKDGSGEQAAGGHSDMGSVVAGSKVSWGLLLVQDIWSFHFDTNFVAVEAPNQIGVIRFSDPSGMTDRGLSNTNSIRQP